MAAAAMNHPFQTCENHRLPPQTALLDNILAAMDQSYSSLGKHPRQYSLPDSQTVLADSLPSRDGDTFKRFRRSPGKIDRENKVRKNSKQSTPQKDSKYEKSALDSRGKTAQMHSDSGALVKGDVCTHTTTANGLCEQCGEKVVTKRRSGLPFTYLCKGVSDNMFIPMRNIELSSLFRNKKLYLVLDLDHTLLNSTPLAHLTKEENSDLNVLPDDLPDSLKGSLHKLDHMKIITKLRPYVHSFLKEASKMFELYIYTMGERDYALEMAKLLDPQGIYFNSVLSRGDSMNKDQKALDHFLGLESFVLILDDTESVWNSKHRENLLVMDRYNFFASSCQRFGLRCKSHSQQRRDEHETCGALASVLNVLQKIHTSFYGPYEHKENLMNRDVRQLLKIARKKVLKGCKIVFSRIFPSDFRAEDHRLWKLAEDMGAMCCTNIDTMVTHVISLDAGTEKSRWAVLEKKFLVHPSWIETAGFLWRRVPENHHPVPFPFSVPAPNTKGPTSALV